jgi:hypothetical protein
MELRELYGFTPVGSLADDVESLARENGAAPLSDDRMIVGIHNSHMHDATQ